MTDEQYEWLKSILGARTPSEDDAADAYDRLGSIKAVALESLRRWRADLIANPTTVNVPGAIGVGYSANITALERLIADVTAGPDDPTTEPPVDPDAVPPVGVVFAQGTYQRPRASALSTLRRRGW